MYTLLNIIKYIEFLTSLSSYPWGRGEQGNKILLPGLTFIQQALNAHHVPVHWEARKGAGYRSRDSKWIQIPLLLLISCVNLGKSLNLFACLLTYKKGLKTITESLWEANELVRCKAPGTRTAV